MTDHPAPSPTTPLGHEIDAGDALDRRLAQQLGRGGARPSRADVGGYVDALDRRPPLQSVERERMVREAQRGDAAARAAVVDAFMPLVAKIARGQRSPVASRQELLQEGVVGLLRALERFDPDRGVPFVAYAGWWVRQAMQQLVAELSDPVVLSDRALRALADLRRAHEELLRAAGRPPTEEELAVATGISPDRVHALLAATRPAQALEAPLVGRDGEADTFGGLLRDPLAEDAYERTLDAIEVEGLHRLLAGLSDRERDVLRARYGVGMPEGTLREVGERMGLSAERVRQIERRALNKLSAAMGGRRDGG